MRPTIYTKLAIKHIKDDLSKSRIAKYAEGFKVITSEGEGLSYSSKAFKDIDSVASHIGGRNAQTGKDLYYLKRLMIRFFRIHKPAIS